YESAQRYRSAKTAQHKYREPEKQHNRCVEHAEPGISECRVNRSLDLPIVLLQFLAVLRQKPNRIVNRQTESDPENQDRRWLQRNIEESHQSCRQQQRQ